MTKSVIQSIAIAVLTLGVACSHDSPTSPTAASSTTLAARSAAAVPNTAASATSASADHGASNNDHGSSDKNTSELEGLITAVDATAHTIVVRGTTVSVPAGAVIRHGHTMLTFADLKVGDRVHVKASQRGATTVASEVNVQNEDMPGDRDDEHARARGTVSGLAGTCPALTFMLGTTKVTTDATTVFRGVTCAQLANGSSVHVEGTQQADGTLAAARVRLDVPEPDDDHETDHMEGTVSGLAGACPALTFSVGTLKVSTSASTTFRGGSCGQLANGVRVEVTGMSQADGSVGATHVTFDDDDSR